MKRTPLSLSAALTAMAAITGPAFAATLQPSPHAALPALTTAHLPADRDGDHLFDNLAAQLAAAPADQPLPVIVRYLPGREPARIAAARDEERLALDHSVAIRLTPAQIRRLAASGAVESVEADARCYATRDTAEASFGVTQAAADFALKGDGDGDPTGYSAKDHTIAIIDTGIDALHQDFAGGKVIAWQDFVNHRPQPYDDQGHGTHVASIAAGAVNAQGVGGVAPGAALVGLKVLGADGSGATSTIAAAVEWCIAHRQQYGIEVINMSLGGDGSSDGTDALSRTVNRAAAAGIVVCVAAGNEGPGPATISTPGAAAEAITVGNMVDLGKGGFALWVSSSRGPTADGRVKPDLCGPGFQILAAEANSGSGYVRLTGTSMATPFVAGVAALMRQANPKLSPAQVKALMKTTTVPFGAEDENNEYGAGRLDAYQALAKAAGKTGAGPAVPNHLYGSGRLASEGADQSWDLPVTDTRFPVAITLIAAAADTDFDLEIYDPSGTRVARAAGDGRQELTSFRPTATGTYTVVVIAYAGSGDYTLDVSGGVEAQ